PRPAPTSTTVNGSGRPSSAHHRSRARASTAPKSGPTSGLVRKSAPARPAPPPVVKKPPSPSYSASSTKRSKVIGPDASMAATTRSVNADGGATGAPYETTGGAVGRARPARSAAQGDQVAGEVAEAADQLGQHAEGHGHGHGDGERGTERHRHLDGRGV